MKFQLNPKYNSYKGALLECINNFEQYENGFGTGKRNSVKKIDLKGLTIVVKSFKRPHLFNQFIYKYFRPSKAKRSYEHALKLLSLGFNTPMPIAYIEIDNFWGLQDSYYISEYLDYDLTIKNLIFEPDYPDQEKILRAFTRFTNDFQGKGIYFLDHSPGNTLISKINGKYDFALVDLNRMQFKQLSFKESLRNYSRLTTNRQMITIISDEFAKIKNLDYQTVFDEIWAYTKQFEEKKNRKKQLKKKFLGKT